MWSQYSQLQDLQKELIDFEKKVLSLMSKLKLSPQDYFADHISVRCNNLVTAQYWQAGFIQCAKILSDKQINGRPIYLFDLAQAIQFAHWRIDCVELPYPTNKVYQHQGWEHIELVIPCQAEQLERTVLARLPDENTLNKLGVTLKMSQPKGNNEVLSNPTLAITDGDITIKFHPYSIREIVESER